MNTSNLSVITRTRNRSVRTRRYNLLSQSLNIQNYNSSNQQLFNDNNLDNLDNIRCPVCNNQYEIFEFFTHLFTTHEEFLVAWSSLSFPTLDPDDTHSLSAYFRNLGISNDILNNRFDDEFDQLSYEQLTALCDEIGYHKIGIKNIDNVAPAIVRMKKGIDEERCPICLEDMHKTLYMRVIKECQHEFCGNCIEEWFKENKTCPICKLEINEQDDIDDTQISSISESSNGGNDTLRLSPTPTPESSSESLANTTFDVSSSV